MKKKGGSQTVKSLQIILLFVCFIIFICNSAVAVGSVMFCIDQANLMQQGFVFFLTATLDTVCPVVVAGSV